MLECLPGGTDVIDSLLCAYLTRYLQKDDTVSKFIPIYHNVFSLCHIGLV